MGVAYLFKNDIRVLVHRIVGLPNMTAKSRQACGKKAKVEGNTKYLPRLSRHVLSKETFTEGQVLTHASSIISREVFTLAS